jgi:RNA polymerase sigma factor (sigma-70 family)
MANGDTSAEGFRRGFPDTVGGLISQACHSSPEVRRQGLEQLFRAYWKPVYQYLRMAWSKSPDDAKDLTQAFFLWLLEGPALQRYDSEMARFRTYLKTLIRHFVQHEDAAAARLKRGGGLQILSLENNPALLEAAPSSNPDEAFDKAWCDSLMQVAVDRVRERLVEGKRDIQFRVFQEYDLCDPSRRPTYGELARRLALEESDVRNYLFAMREEIRSEIRSEILKLTGDPEQAEEEWDVLFGR